MHLLQFEVISIHFRFYLSNHVLPLERMKKAFGDKLVSAVGVAEADLGVAILKH